MIADPQQTRRVLAPALFLAFVLLSLWKVSPLLPPGRFWAEEGTYFAPAIWSAPGLEGLRFLFQGHLQLVTNLLVWLAGQVPLAVAPAVTTLGALALQWGAAALLVFPARRLGLSAGGCALVLAAMLMITPSEVWANATNAHFHTAVIAGLLLALPCGSRGEQGARLALLALCGLSGVPANFLGPFFLLRALLERDQARGAEAAVLLLTAGVQLVLIMLNRDAVTGRDFALEASLLLVPLAKIAAYPLLDGIALDWSLARLTHLRDGDLRLIWLPLLLLLPHAALGWAAWRQGNLAALLMLAAAFFSAILSTFLALGSPEEYLTVPSAAARYYHAPLVFLVLAAALVAGRHPAPWLFLALLCWFLHPVTGLFYLLGLALRRIWAPSAAVVAGLWLLVFLQQLPMPVVGPAWAPALAAREGNIVAIWPTGWEIALPPGY